MKIIISNNSEKDTAFLKKIGVTSAGLVAETHEFSNLVDAAQRLTFLIKNIAEEEKASRLVGLTAVVFADVLRDLELTRKQLNAVSVEMNEAK